MLKGFRLFVLGFTIFIVGGLFSSALAAIYNENERDNSIQLIKRTEPIKPLSTRLSGDARINRVIVKFKENSDIRLRNKRMVSLKNNSTAEINNILAPYLDSRVKRLAPRPENEINLLKESLELASKHELADFNLYYWIDVTDPAEAAALVDRLNGLETVEIAYAEPTPEPAGDIDPPTPDYEPQQLYRTAAPAGVDADYANTLPGGDGMGVKIVDVENSWNEAHEDLEKAVGGTINGGNQSDGHHGTAVIGAMISGDNGYGVTGICPGADIAMASASLNGTPEAILMAADNLEAGDIMLIELHAPGPRYDFQVRSDQLGYICIEYWQANFDAMLYAWAKGIIVVEAAGNGAEDLDDVIYESVYDTTYRNSHAIVIGAGAPPSGSSGPDRSRLGFSNYGDRVNLQGYGREVFTTGYGNYWDGDGDINQYYTASFSGTSSASPIVAGAVACLQGYYISTYGVPMAADYARDVLVATGSVQAGDTTEHIGPRPDLAAATTVLNPPPSMYADPMLVDTTLNEGESAVFDVWLHNRSDVYALDYSITVDQYLFNPDSVDWLTAVPEEGTIATLDSIMITVNVDASLIAGNLDWTKGMVEINWNITGGSLDSLTYLPVFLIVPCVDDTTYEVVSSNDPEGPAFNWIDITAIGDAVPFPSFYNPFASDPLDDGSAGPFDIPFDFPYFGSTYNQYYIGVNGGISFTDEHVNDGGYYGTFYIPGDYPFTTFIPVFWNDFLMGSTHGAHGSIYTYASPTNDTVIIEWWQMGTWGSADDTLSTFELILTADGNISMQYYDVGTSGHENNTLIGLAEVECTVEPYFNHGEPVENTVGDSVRVDFVRQYIPTMAGDADGNETINILDLTYLIAYLYQEGPEPCYY